MTTLDAQLGIKEETVYGTPVTVTKFYDFNSETMQPDFRRIESRGVRAGIRVPRSTAFVPYVGGAAGDVVMDVPTKNFAMWLRMMLGAISTGTVTDLNYTHTATFGDLTGDSFTMQIGYPFVGSSTVSPRTFHGCKITDWSFSCEAEGILQSTASIDAEDVDTSTALATAAYASGYDVFTFIGGSLTIGGSAVELRSFEVSCSNGLDVDRRFLRGNPLKKEPTENDFRELTWSATADFTDTTQYARFASTTAAGALGAIVATFVGPQAHAGSTLPQIVFSIPAARFDEVAVNVSGPEALQQDLSGVGLYDGTNSPITITYRTTDATP